MTRLAFDMSSYLKTALLAAKDLKDGRVVIFEGEEVLVNSAEYGYENVTNMMVKTLADTGLRPINCVLVFEGRNSKAKRLLIDPLYKSKRDKRPPEFYEEFNRLKDYVEQVWKDLGAIAASQDGVEADDVLAYLAQESEEDLIISSRDNDLGALIGVNKYGARVRFHRDGSTLKARNEESDVVMLSSEPFVHPTQYITLYKALVGDSSDSIGGVKGFGPAMFQNMLEQYGYDGADELIGLLQQGKLDALHGVAAERHASGSKKNKPVHPIIAKIIEYEQDAVRSWKLAKMYPDWVTFHRPTVQNHLQFRPGKVAPCPDDADARLKHWYGQQYLVTADNFIDAMEMLREQMPLTMEPDFDIESSTPPESDDWLAALGDPDGVDQLGQVLTGFSVTFGDNKQHTFYVSVDHRDTANVKMSQARQLIEVVLDSVTQRGDDLIIQNTFFELTVLGQACDEDGTLWMDLWQKYGFRGFLPNVLDTKFEANYTNENEKSGLKGRSKLHLGYDQASFEATTSKVGHPDELPAGGKLKEVLEYDHVCRSCGSKNFKASKKHGLCEFCDGTEGGVVSTPKEIKAWNAEHPDDVTHDKIPVKVRRQYKMNELTALEVIEYGCDDTICTGALHRFYKFIMQLEHQWQTYLDTEIKAAYQHAKNFLDGLEFSLQKMRELEADDKVTFDKAWVTVRAYLMEHGWAGTVPPTYGADITAKQIKEAYKIVVLGAGEGEIEIEDLKVGDDDDEEAPEPAAESEEEEEAAKDAFLSTRARTPSKLAILARELGHETFAGMVEQCLAGHHEKFTAWVREHFTGEPIFAISNKQMQKLLYEVMQLPIKVRNKPTDIMRKAGLPGNPKGDALAVAYALRDGTPEQVEVLKSLQLMQMVKTRRSLYYKKYPYAIHWKTGRIHPIHNQCHANTRRASMSKVNTQQLPKHPKIEGYDARYRETIVPHHPDAVIVSLDEDSQELRVIADYSQDPNMVSAFVGDNKKSLHSLTGHGIALRKKKVPVDLTYEEFDRAAKDKSHPLYKVCAEHRALGKKVNFTTEFGAMAPKLAMTLLVDEAEAQVYIDAKEANFPGVRKWKDAVIAESKREGIVRTMEGAVRHLTAAYMGDDYWLKSKAERQAVNFKVQSSSAEMVKKAEGRVWDRGLTYRFDAVCYGPVHDELVFSVMKSDLLPFLKEAHWCMVQPYGGMVIPIVSSISFGPNFGQQIEIGSEPTEEAVAEGLRKMEELLAKAKSKTAPAVNKQAAVAA